MRLEFLFKFAKQNLKNHKKLNLPYLIASSILFSFCYICYSLANNSALLERGGTILVETMSLANVLVGLMTGIFVLYANNFYQKQRSQEFGLYSIFGLEKKHIRAIVRTESFLQLLVVIPLSIIGGHLFGSLLFMMTNRFLQSKLASVYDYPLTWQNVIYTIIVILVVWSLAYLQSVRRIQRYNPIELMNKQKEGEKEPKSNWFVLIVGILSLSVGYYLALQAKTVHTAILLIFFAVLLVILGTYCLYTSLSIFVLKALRRNKKFYYKPTNFLSISGMLYRMKANAVSLASIAILTTGVFLVGGLTLSLYSSTQSSVDRIQPMEFQATIANSSRDEVESVFGELMGDINDIAPISETSTVDQAMVLTKSNKKDYLALPDPDMYLTYPEAYLTIAMTVDDFNSTYGEDYKLKSNQILLTDNANRLKDNGKFTINGVEYDPIVISNEYIMSLVSSDMCMVIFPDEGQYQQFVADFSNESTGNTTFPSDNVNNLNFNVEYSQGMSKEEITKLNNEIVKLIESHDLDGQSKTEFSKFLYDINGGLLLLGVTVSAVLIVGVGIMLYYKQISEGSQDQFNFLIMKKVGLPDSLIKQTINRQTRSLFAMPIVSALVNMGFASTILSSLLRALSINDHQLVFKSFMLVVVVFTIAYLLFYILTSRVYYQIVNPKIDR